MPQNSPHSQVAPWRAPIVLPVRPERSGLLPKPAALDDGAVDSRPLSERIRACGADIDEAWPEVRCG